MTETADVVRLLTDALPHATSTDPADLAASRVDQSGWVADGTPLAVVHATGIDDVQATLRIASQTGTPVVTRGAGTGLAGGGCGSAGTIVLSVAGMNRILEIRPEDELAVVQPGVVNGDLNDALAEYGLWFAPDPASRAISSVGGNIATNAGGLLCAKYGVTREAVLGLKVVLADGRLLETGHRTVKGVTGYDLTALLTGSEGTLGVIVEATVRARSRPAGAVSTLGAVFPDAAAAAHASARVTAAGLRPAVMEIIDEKALAAIAAHLGSSGLDGLPLDGGAYLLLQTDGPAAADEAGQAADVLRAAGSDPQVSADDASADRLLAIRRSVHPALAAQGQVLIEDVSVPRSRMAEMFRVIDDISARTGIPIPTVAHAGDGNLHPNFVIPVDPDAPVDASFVPDEVWEAAGELFRAALELGGTLTGEHGVGVLKRRWLADELGETGYDLQRQLKAVFDPQGILNPGTMFPPEAVRPA